MAVSPFTPWPILPVLILSLDFLSYFSPTGLSGLFSVWRTLSICHVVLVCEWLDPRPPCCWSRWESFGNYTGTQPELSESMLSYNANTQDGRISQQSFPALHDWFSSYCILPLLKKKTTPWNRAKLVYCYFTLTFSCGVVFCSYIVNPLYFFSLLMKLRSKPENFHTR